ncbi:MAG: dihydropteroate synthase [Burkholderiales bacterium]|jgi:dihydropteroate synthase
MSRPDAFVCGRFTLSLDRPLIMGVVNITPDSFSDGGDFLDATSAVAHARRLVDEGADILDLGGESSRPGSSPVSLTEEGRRVLPVLEKVVHFGVPVSVDTTKPDLMREAIASGASIINDITALRSPGAVEAIVDSDAGVCLMHMQGEPGNMQKAPAYDDVVAEVSAFLDQRARCLLDSGVSASRIMLDPGFGFGKTHQHNLQLLHGLSAIAQGRFVVLAGLSRKSQLGRITGRTDAKSRLGSSIAAALAAVSNGASIVRVHDVAETKDALLVWQAFESSALTSGAMQN